MRVVTEIIQHTYCECGEELHSPEEWSVHRSRHTIEYWNETPERRRILNMVMGDLRLHREHQQERAR